MSAGSSGVGIPVCPDCGGQEIWRKGVTSAGKRQWFCRSCERSFVVDPYMPADIKELADRMICEDIPVPIIAKVMKGFVSRRWLYNRRNDLISCSSL